MTFEHEENGQTIGYDKVIMLAGGVGYAHADHSAKRTPKKGDYNTVRDIVEYPEYSRVGIRLEELSNPPIEKSDGTLHEPTFNIFRFRELEVPPPIEEEIHNMLEEEFEIINPDDDQIFK